LDIVASNNRSVSASTHRVQFGSVSVMTRYGAHPFAARSGPCSESSAAFWQVILDQLIGEANMISAAGLHVKRDNIASPSHLFPSV
jgi:hypothetical protein